MPKRHMRETGQVLDADDRQAESKCNDNEQRDWHTQLRDFSVPYGPLDEARDMDRSSDNDKHVFLLEVKDGWHGNIYRLYVRPSQLTDVQLQHIKYAQTANDVDHSVPLALHLFQETYTYAEYELALLSIIYGRTSDNNVHFSARGVYDRPEDDDFLIQGPCHVSIVVVHS
jgi:hypothetical protein